MSASQFVPEFGIHAGKYGQHATTGWIEITELSPAPAGIPLQVRVVLSDVAIALPLMYSPAHRAENGERLAAVRAWRHINRAPDERGAWLDPAYRPTHWQLFADPFIARPRYTVVMRTYRRGGLVQHVPRVSGLSFDGAVAELGFLRAVWRDLWANQLHAPQAGRELFILTDGEAERLARCDDLVDLALLPGHVRRIGAAA